MKTEEVNEPLQEAPADPVEDEVDENLDNDPEDEPEGADGQEDAAAGYHSTSDLSAFLRVLNAKNLTKEQLALLAEIFKLDVKNGKLVERKKTKKAA